MIVLLLHTLYVVGGLSALGLLAIAVLQLADWWRLRRRRR